MQEIQIQITELWSQALEVWLSGGWAMPAIAIVALAMFSLGMHILLNLRAKGFASISEQMWRNWLDNPQLRRGPIGDLLNFVDGNDSFKETSAAFAELTVTEIAPFERDLRIMKICVGAAPLLGLLGTVTGMLATFGALAEGSGDKAMAMIASGISEALITTETGLVIALPGLFFQHVLSNRQAKYKTFLAHIESVYTQRQYFKNRTN